MRGRAARLRVQASAMQESLNKTPPPTDSQPLSAALLLLMSTATGLAVASNYYAQPLLPTIGRDLQLSESAVASIVTTAQLSYGAGLFLLVPLADLRERRSLIVCLMLVAAMGLVLSGVAPNLPMLLLGTAITGLTSVVAQVLVPFAATLAEPAHRGRAVGTVMSGLLFGILLARTFAGAISTFIHWRAVYGIAAVLMVACTLALARGLPRFQQDAGLSYRQLIQSVLELFVQEPILRLRALLGMVSLALFSMFWTPLSFLLSTDPYHYSEAVIGLFGLVGAAGALAANAAGRLADKGKGTVATFVGLGVLLISWLPLGFAQSSLIALILGVLLLDLAVQMVHVSNQNAIYAIRPEARNRLNAGYMTCYFIGGASGTTLSAWLYMHHGWMGVVWGASVIAMVGLVIGMVGLRRRG